MTTAVLKKTRKTKAAEKAKMGNKPTILIQVEDLRIGDEIATVLQESQYGAKLAAKTKKVESIDLCEGMWRTHLHINRMDCYDSRAMIRIVGVPDESMIEGKDFEF